jgi:hypothetical protein
MIPLPRWARVVDTATLTLLVVAADVLVFGGFHLHVAGLRVSVGAPWRPALWALAFCTIRHLLIRRDPLSARLERGWRVFAGWMVSHPSGSRWARTGALFRIATVVLFVASLQQFYRRDTGFTLLIGFGDAFATGRLPAVHAVPHYTHRSSAGYDGQFYAQLAFDPLLRQPAFLARALDDAPYRSRRILFAWTAHVIGLGRPFWILQAYAVQNIVAWLLLAWLLLRWFPLAEPRSFLPWVGCLFSAGLIESVGRSLLEGPSLVILTLAIIAAERDRLRLATGLMALAGLGKETNLLGSGLLVARLPRAWREVFRTAVALLLVALPYVLWSMYARSRWYSFVFSNPANFSMPFHGYAEKWLVTLNELRASGWTSPARMSLVALVSLTTQAGFLLARREWGNPWWRAGAAYCAFMPLLGTAVWEGHPGAAVRVLLPMTVAFNALVVRSRWYWPLVIVGNSSVLYGLWSVEVPWLSRYL